MKLKSPLRLEEIGDSSSEPTRGERVLEMGWPSRVRRFMLP